MPAAHVHIQHLQAGLVVMPKALTVGSGDLIKAVLHLADILARAGIQSFLYHRLLGTRLSAKGVLQSRVGPQTGIDFHQPVGSG